MQAEGVVAEILLLDRLPAARIRCAQELIPAPGQYVLAHAAGSDAPLADVLFASGIAEDGFVAAPPAPRSWNPGTRLYLRGPLGRGFGLPESARRVALIAFDGSPRTLLSLLGPALRQQAAVALITPQIPEDLPFQVEVQPPHALLDICKWADFIALDIVRAALPGLREKLEPSRIALKASGQVLVRAPMPCGALADCGVCTVELGRRAFLTCEDGPVFELDQVMGWASKA